MKSSVVCAVCMNNGYLHFTCRQYNPVSTQGEGSGICNETLPQGWGISHLIKFNPLVCPTFAQEGGKGHRIDRCITTKTASYRARNEPIKLKDTRAYTRWRSLDPRIVILVTGRSDMHKLHLYVV